VPFTGVRTPACPASASRGFSLRRRGARQGPGRGLTETVEG